MQRLGYEFQQPANTMPINRNGIIIITSNFAINSPPSVAPNKNERINIIKIPDIAKTIIFIPPPVL
jgi:hypothetical protein